MEFQRLIEIASSPECFRGPADKAIPPHLSSPRQVGREGQVRWTPARQGVAPPGEPRPEGREARL
ncbi:MAG: hypothetical protein QME51_09600, partial [Planctomycetota bacterium]|nr:hypothetical protein [Planctomycetota bacterium]